MVSDDDPAGERAPSEEHDELPETIRHRLERLVPELVKKTFAAGLGAVFSTEEGIRKIARETREFLASLNVSEEIAKILTTLSFEIKTEIRFIPNSERYIGAEPDVKASVRLKRADEGKVEKADKTDRADRHDKHDRVDDEDGRPSRSRLRFWQRDKDGDDESDDDGHDKPDK